MRRSYQFTKNGLEALGSSLDGCMWIGLVVGHAPPSLAMRHGMPEEGCSMVSGGIRGIRAQMRPKILTEKRFPINFRGSEDKPNDHHQYAHRRLYYVKFTFKIRQRSERLCILRILPEIPFISDGFRCSFSIKISLRLT